MTIEVIRPLVRDLGAFQVKRALPAARQRSVGPFVFFDHFGPVLLPAGQGMDVRPHPHIGLATVTYLLEGAGLHRDSLGTVQEIRVGDVNWMVAGRGIVHSERTPAQEMARAHRLHGVQIWIALPKSEELCAPSFSHHPAQTLPEIDLSGARVRILIGQAYGASAPTQTFSPTLYMHVRLDAGASLPIEAKYEERAVYAIDSQIRVDGERLNTCEMAILPEGRDTEVRAEAAAQFMVLGGAPLDGPRRIDWNFVSSSSELIDQARQSWKNFPNEQFGLVPDETEWIPLPQ